MFYGAHYAVIFTFLPFAFARDQHGKSFYKLKDVQTNNQKIIVRSQWKR